MRFVISLLFISFCQISLAQNNLDEDIRNIPSIIMGINTTGFWRDDGPKGAGYYRFIITTGGVGAYKNSLYIQWVRYDENTDFPELLTSIPISEFNNDDAYYAFSMPVCGNDSCSLFHLEARDTLAMGSHTFTIELQDIGKYKLTEHKPTEELE